MVLYLELTFTPGDPESVNYLKDRKDGNCMPCKKNVVINTPALHTTRVIFFFFFWTGSGLFCLGRVVLREVADTRSQGAGDATPRRLRGPEAAEVDLGGCPLLPRVEGTGPGPNYGYRNPVQGPMKYKHLGVSAWTQAWETRSRG